MKIILQPKYAGTWYPAEKKELWHLIENHFSKWEKTLAEENAALESSQNISLDRQSDKAGWSGYIAPHAGYLYSGFTASAAYYSMKQNLQNPAIAILLVPSHRIHFHGIATLRSIHQIETPLGKINVNNSILEELDETIFFDEPEYIEIEHAAEMHYPFIEYLNQSHSHTNGGSMEILPLLLSAATEENIITYSFHLFQAIQSALTKESDNSKQIFIIASSDLSHFHNAKEAEKLDCQIMSSIRHSLQHKQVNSFLENAKQGTFEACGTIAIAMLIEILNRKYSQSPLVAKELHRTHSGKVTGDYQKVVGYLSAKIQPKNN